ncbi:MAG: hypothetical protein U0871_17660 [Gemmataceae bacterium]
MSAVLSIPVPDHVLARLRERAAELGSTPEQVAAADLAQAASPVRPSERLRRLAGSIPLGDSNVAERVDELLGDALIDELRGRPDA